MAIIVPNEGEIELLDKMLVDALHTNETYILRLFKNDYTPSATTVVGSFLEADFTNYAEKTLTRGGFNSAVLNAYNEAEVTYGGEQSWTCGATGNTIYGYYVVGNTSGRVLWCQRFGEPRPMGDGDIIRFTPAFTFKSAN
jgi:hypothetical protein